MLLPLCSYKNRVSIFLEAVQESILHRFFTFEFDL